MYYENLRWQNWRKEIRNLSGDSVYTFFPFLCTEEGGDINQFSRKPIAIAEHYASTLDLQKSILQGMLFQTTFLSKPNLAGNIT